MPNGHTQANIWASFNRLSRPQPDERLYVSNFLALTLCVQQPSVTVAAQMLSSQRRAGAHGAAS
jgi:hypothetical protein